jgi:hypothetical protein
LAKRRPANPWSAAGDGGYPLAGELVPGFLDGLAQRGVAGQLRAGDASTSISVTPGSLPISAVMALAQWSQLMPVTIMVRVSTVVILEPDLAGRRAGSMPEYRDPEPVWR